MNSDKRYKENIVKSRFFRLYPRDHAIDPLIIEPTDPHEPRFGFQSSTLLPALLPIET